MSESGVMYLYQLWQETATNFALESDECVEPIGLKFITQHYQGI